MCRPQKIFFTTSQNCQAFKAVRFSNCFWLFWGVTNSKLEHGKTCKKIPCYIHGPACRWRKIYWSYVEGALSGLMINAFLIHLKGSLILEVFKFLSWLLVMQKNGLIRKIRLISKFITSNLERNQSQYTYISISQEVKAIRQWNVVN